MGETICVGKPDFAIYPASFATAPAKITCRRALIIFESFFIRGVCLFQVDIADKIVAVDGNTSCRSFDGNSKPANG